MNERAQEIRMKKKSDEIIQPIIDENEFEKKSKPVAPKKAEHSPSKDELKKMLVEAQAKIESLKYLNDKSSKILKTLKKKRVITLETFLQPQKVTLMIAEKKTILLTREIRMKKLITLETKQIKLMKIMIRKRRSLKILH